ncbi:hypothetical protein RhiJN_16521 [Ceratobasidium sp. AG-Ba]|nr:hypothetical protein RhiJN_16521 [Ceratobasidium sp. AG-Ba]
MDYKVTSWTFTPNQISDGIGMLFGYQVRFAVHQMIEVWIPLSQNGLQSSPSQTLLQDIDSRWGHCSVVAGASVSIGPGYVFSRPDPPELSRMLVVLAKAFQICKDNRDVLYPEIGFGSCVWFTLNHTTILRGDSPAQMSMTLACESEQLPPTVAVPSSRLEPHFTVPRVNR